MSQVAIRAALESQVAAMQPALATAWQNQSFVPPDPAQPYQVVSLLFADPANPEMGRGYQEQGFMQVELMYPPNSGSVDAALRAEAIRALFAKGKSFVSNGVKVVIPSTPAIGAGATDGDRWRIPVKVLFYANFF